MGKLNEIQEQTTQSWGSNSFTTKITDQTVEFDSAKDSFTFMDEVNVPALKVNGQSSVAFTEEEKAKLATVTSPMNMKGRVDSVADLPTEDVQVGDTYLVGPEGSENFEEYVCTALEGSPETPVWENIGHIKVQPDWNQNDSNASDFIKNRTHYVETTGAETIVDDEFSFTSEEDSGVYYNSYMGETDLDPFASNSTYFVTIGNNTYETTSDNWGEISYNTEDGFDENGISSFSISVMFSMGTGDSVLSISVTANSAYTTENIKIEGEAEEVHQLDEKFIPDSIARTSDIPAAQVQSDWNQSDSEYPDFIKNKPIEEIISCVKRADDVFTEDMVILDTTSTGSELGKNDFIQYYQQHLIDTYHIDGESNHNATLIGKCIYLINNNSSNHTQYGGFEIPQLVDVVSDKVYDLKIGDTDFIGYKFVGTNTYGAFQSPDGDYQKTINYSSYNSGYILYANTIQSLPTGTYPVSIYSKEKAMICTQGGDVKEADFSNYNAASDTGTISFITKASFDLSKTSADFIFYNAFDDSIVMTGISTSFTDEIKNIAVITNYSTSPSVSYIETSIQLTSISNLYSYSASRFALIASSSSNKYILIYDTGTWYTRDITSDYSNAVDVYVDSSEVVVARKTTRTVAKLSKTTDNENWSDSAKSWSGVNSIIRIGKLNSIYFAIDYNSYIYAVPDFSSTSGILSQRIGSGDKVNFVYDDGSLLLTSGGDLYKVDFEGSPLAISFEAIAARQSNGSGGTSSNPVTLLFKEISSGTYYYFGYCGSKIVAQLESTKILQNSSDIYLFYDCTIKGSTGKCFLGIYTQLNPVTIKKIDGYDCYQNQNVDKFLYVQNGGVSYKLNKSMTKNERGFRNLSSLISLKSSSFENDSNYISSKAGEIYFKIDGAALKVSLDSGTTWQTVTLS